MLSLVERLAAVERDILYSLVGESGEQSIWTLDELARDVGYSDDADLAVRALLQGGLIHRTCDGFLFASQPARDVVQMIGHVV